MTLKSVSCLYSGSFPRLECFTAPYMEGRGVDSEQEVGTLCEDILEGDVDGHARLHIEWPQGAWGLAMTIKRDGVLPT